MKAILFAAGLAAAAAAAPQAALAQSSVDDARAVEALSNCLTMRSTGEDHVNLAAWVVVALASAPQLAGIADIEPGTKDELDKRTAAIFTRLMTVDCLAEAKPLAQARNSEGFQEAGRALGRIAMQEVLGNPRAAESLNAFTRYLREEDFAVLGL